MDSLSGSGCAVMKALCSPGPGRWSDEGLLAAPHSDSVLSSQGFSSQQAGNKWKVLSQEHDNCRSPPQLLQLPGRCWEAVWELPSHWCSCCCSLWSHTPWWWVSSGHMEAGAGAGESAGPFSGGESLLQSGCTLRTRRISWSQLNKSKQNLCSDDNPPPTCVLFPESPFPVRKEQIHWRRLCGLSTRWKQIAPALHRDSSKLRGRLIHPDELWFLRTKDTLTMKFVNTEAESVRISFF